MQSSSSIRYQLSCLVLEFSGPLLQIGAYSLDLIFAADYVTLKPRLQFERVCLVQMPSLVDEPLNAANRVR